MRQLTLTTGRFGFEECPACRSVLAKPQPTVDELTAAYERLISHADPDWSFGPNDQLDPYRRALMGYAKRSAPGTDLVEIGGGAGSFGRAMKQRGWTYVDYEPTASAADIVGTDLEVHQFDYAGLPPIPENSADVVVMWEVIEHVWPIAEYLDVIRRALRPGGLFLLSTPNWLRQGYLDSLLRPDPGAATSPPVHLNFFTAPAVEKVLQAAQFKQVLVHKRRLYSPGRDRKTLERAVRIATGHRQSPTVYGVFKAE
jgi:2-polyprenyl-3-methyl-5-hydroxy-6-metoxy-1,4-benzoquinol methylase